MRIFEKPHLNIEEQIKLLSERGLIVDDKDRAKEFLSSISYYRLGYYFRDFYSDLGKTQFRDGITFEHVLRHYFFDRELRLLVFDAIERLEIAFRTQISYHYSLNKNDEKWWYTNPKNFKNPERLKLDLSGIQREINRSKEPFIKAYLKNYDYPELPPSWITFEVVTMTSISKIFDNMKLSQEKKDITRHFHLTLPDILESWMRSISYVRNLCAHHSKLWNRTLILRPMIPRNPVGQWLKVNPLINKMDGEKQIELERIYVFLSCCIYLLKIINPDTHFILKFKNLLKQYPEIEMIEMGFPALWEDEPLWNS